MSQPTPSRRARKSRERTMRLTRKEHEMRLAKLHVLHATAPGQRSSCGVIARPRASVHTSIASRADPSLDHATGPPRR